MAPHTPVTILLIDDDLGFVSALARGLRHDGSTVDTVADGHAALTHLQTHRYDVVLCDLRMPARDGPAFYAILSRQYPDLRQRVIFLTGETLGVASTAFLAQCGQPWVSKPCTAAAIRRAMQQVLRAGVTTGTGEPRPEEGTLSIVRRGQRYQVRYASNNPYAQDYPMHECADEAHLAALLHHCGTESAVMTQVCADVRQGKMAVLLVALSAEQLQTCFLPPPETSARGRPSSSRPPRGQALRAHSREARGEAEQLRQELALLLEEAALLREEAVLALEESHQLLASCQTSL
jgi:CheY-like chemotaxis protein